MGEEGRGLEAGSELERMLEKDMTPAARLVLWKQRLLSATGYLQEGQEQRGGRMNIANWWCVGTKGERAYG